MNSQELNGHTELRCGARDWQGTFPGAAWLTVWLRKKHVWAAVTALLHGFEAVCCAAQGSGFGVRKTWVSRLARCPWPGYYLIFQFPHLQSRGKTAFSKIVVKTEKMRTGLSQCLAHSSPQ